MIKLAFHFEDDVPTEILMAHPEVDAVDHGTRCCAFSVAVFAVMWNDPMFSRKPFFLARKSAKVVDPT